MPFSNFSFNIVKSNDSMVYTTLCKISDEISLSLQKIILYPLFGGTTIQGSQTEIDQNESFQKILEEKSELINQFHFQYNQNVQLVVGRVQNQTHDTLSFNFNNLADNNIPLVIEFVAKVRKQLKAIDSDIVLKGVISDELKRHYELRETELTKLEEISESIIYRQEQFLQEKEKDYQAKKDQLDKKYSEKFNELEESFKIRENKLNEEKDNIEKKLKDINDHESKHERRRLREDLKKELKNRSEKFELTQGTRKLRNPIFIFTIILIVVFGSGLITYSILSISQILSDKQNSTVLISLLIKQITFAIAFGSTSVFFIRWNNKWFGQHSNEEFRLKRHEIDLDRASWIVEMALEWRTDKEGELPVELIEKLSQNLFVENKEDDSPLHPADQLSSAIFGAASNITLKAPNGTEITLDRKSVERLKKSKAT